MSFVKEIFAGHLDRRKRLLSCLKTVRLIVLAWVIGVAVRDEDYFVGLLKLRASSLSA